MNYRRWLPPVLLSLFVLVILVPISPLYRPVPSDDPSVYLYAGEQVLEGAAPYREVWDHKQPLAFLLYAFSLVLTPHSMWGIWLVEWVGLTAAALLGYDLLRRVTTRGMSLLAVGAMLLTLVVVLWSYSLEELTLPLQVFVLWAFARWIEIGQSRTSRNLTPDPSPKGEGSKKRGAITQQQYFLAFAIGLATGLCFFLKQSLIAAGLAVGLYLLADALIGRRWRNLMDLGSMAGGFVLVALAVMGYLAANNALQAYADSAFAFNLAYANLGLVERANAMLDALEFMGGIPGLFLASALWLACVGIAFLQSGPALATVLCGRWFRAAAVVGGMGLIGVSLLGEVVGSEAGLGLAQGALLAAGAGMLAVAGVASSGRLREAVTNWLREAPVLPADDPKTPVRQGLFFLAVLYFPAVLGLITLSGRNYMYYFIPVVPLLLLAWGLVSGILPPRWKPGTVLMGSLALALAFNPILLLVSGYRAQRNPPLPEIVPYIQANTSPDESILVWGKYVTYAYFLSERKAPTRYFYQAPLALEAYNQRFQVADEVLRDMQANPPALFLMGLENPSPESQGCPLAGSEAPNSEGRIFAFVCERYQFEGKVGEFWVFRSK